jgi:chorismate dehydratase
VIVSRSSMTSVALLELLFASVWNARPRFVAGDAEVSDLALLDREPHDARLVIGDAALLLTADDGPAAMHREPYTHAYDLGGEWKRWTGLPFVFAVWVAHAHGAGGRGAARARLAHRRPGLGARAPGRAGRGGRGATGVARARCRAYLSGLDYGLSYPHLAGLDGILPPARGTWTRAQRHPHLPARRMNVPRDLVEHTTNANADARARHEADRRA